MSNPFETQEKPQEDPVAVEIQEQSIEDQFDALIKNCRSAVAKRLIKQSKGAYEKLTANLDSEEWVAEKFTKIIEAALITARKNEKTARKP